VSQYTTVATTTPNGVAINLGAVATNGVGWIQNCDATNYVEVGVRDGGGTFIALLMIKAGEAWPCRITAGVPPYVRANTASVVVKNVIMDD
jgi:hypothetical protein